MTAKSPEDLFQPICCHIYDAQRRELGCDEAWSSSPICVSRCSYKNRSFTFDTPNGIENEDLCDAIVANTLGTPYTSESTRRQTRSGVGAVRVLRALRKLQARGVERIQIPDCRTS
ncbi:hypothetical protein CC2G_013361 [Coprinopsis cinerea AmutBmut pab1-1]|nr:hypothetical protein CC2G_013361 [Coprinopsis cinerea AmutBmut pab1-1]